MDKDLKFGDNTESSSELYCSTLIKSGLVMSKEYISPLEVALYTFESPISNALMFKVESIKICLISTLVNFKGILK